MGEGKGGREGTKLVSEWFQLTAPPKASTLTLCGCRINEKWGDNTIHICMHKPKMRRAGYVNDTPYVQNQESSISMACSAAVLLVVGFCKDMMGLLPFLHVTPCHTHHHSHTVHIRNHHTCHTGRRNRPHTLQRRQHSLKHPLSHRLSHLSRDVTFRRFFSIENCQWQNSVLT